MSFEYEHEVRIRITPKAGLSNNPEEFMMLSVDLNELIEAVYVSPMAESWFKTVVEDILEKYNVEKAVHHSRLDSKALYYGSNSLDTLRKSKYCKKYSTKKI